MCSYFIEINTIFEHIIVSIFILFSFNIETVLLSITTTYVLDEK